MRPISKQHSAIRYPLDSILGSEAHVRLLRVFIHEADTPLSASDAARIAGLTPAGARKALERLVESGVIERVGSGRTPQYGLRGKEPVVRALGLLFIREQERYDSFVSSLQSALADLPEIRTAWLGELPMGAGEPIEISVVAEAQAIDWIGEELRSRLVGLEKESDLIVEVALFTRADSPAPGPHAFFLRSMEADQIPQVRQPARSHSQTEERALLMAREIADLIRSDPSLITRAKHHLNRLLHDDQGTATGDIAEWRQLLETHSPKRLRQLLVSRSSRANRLRQSSPFFAILTAEERDRLIASLEHRQ